jgi:hypothetical protein
VAAGLLLLPPLLFGCGSTVGLGCEGALRRILMCKRDAISFLRWYQQGVERKTHGCETLRAGGVEVVMWTVRMRRDDARCGGFGP